jgi:membrane protein
MGKVHPRKNSRFQTLKRTATEFSDDNLTDWAAALTYYAVLSIFPALIALVSIVGLVGDPKEVTDTLTDIVGSLGPQSAVDALRGPIEDVTESKGSSGILLIAGIAAALWSASGYTGAFMRASNQIYEREEGRPFYKLRPLQLLVTLVLVLLFALVVVAVVLTGPVAEAVGSAIGIGDTAVTIWNFAKWPVLVALVLFMIGLLYYWAPNARMPGFKWITPGSVVALVAWVLASLAFAVYVANFGAYNKTYGTLGGVVSFLVWMWITNLAILFGAQLNAELERGRELEEGLPNAERRIQLPPRQASKGDQQPVA